MPCLPGLRPHDFADSPALGSVCRFVTLQPLPSSLTRALDFASPNPCPASTGFSSDPVAPVSRQAAPLQVAIHSSWPSPSGGAIRVPVPRALPALPLPPAPAPACRWRNGSYAPKYRPPAALQCGPYAPVSGPFFGLFIGFRCCWRILSPLPWSGRHFHLLCLARRLSLRPVLCWLASGLLR